MTITGFLPYLITGSGIAVTAAILLGLNRALSNASWPALERTAIVRISALVLFGWFALAFALGWSGAFQGEAQGIPTIPFAIVIPILAGAVLLWRSTTIARVVDAVPQSWLVAIQLYRVLGATFLVLYAAGQMPGLFALPAGAGDVVVGLLAPVVALAYARDPHRHSGTVRAWNLFGIADLVVAVATGFLTAPSPFQLFAFDAPNELITAFPLVLVPAYLVPLAILLHIASLAKLRHQASITECAHDCQPAGRASY